MEFESLVFIRDIGEEIILNNVSQRVQLKVI